MDNPQAYFARLKPVHLFRGLTDAQIVEVTGFFALEQAPEQTVLFKEGDEGQDFYIIAKGKVQLSHQEKGQQRILATLVPGDYFGEMALLHGQKHDITAVSLTPVELLHLDKENFNRILRRFPQIHPNMLVSTESRRLYRRLRFNWLAPDEVVYLIARRHPWLLYQSLFAPIGVGVLALVGLGALAVYWDWVLALGLLPLAAIPLFLWGLWIYVDWGNDYFIMTNQRAIYLEKIIGIYDSRLETPLSQVTSVDLRSSDPTSRAMSMGDVILRSYSAPIVMSKVANPRAIAALVEEHWHRARAQQRVAEQEAMRQLIRSRMALPPKAPAASKTADPVLGGKRPRRPLGAQLASALQVRFQEGNIITYRKHWFVLLEDLWRPTASIFAGAALIGLALAGLVPSFIPFGAVLALVLVSWVPLSIWWFYEYVDWRNDIYQVTDDQIVDVVKKPFGQETRKAAPLANILSLKYERPSLTGVVFNYGTVVAQIGNDEFRFEGVMDPVGVQNDVYRRIEAQSAKKAQSEVVKRREEMATWLGTYYQVETEIREEIAKRNQGMQ